jgi:hypothetical protein
MRNLPAECDLNSLEVAIDGLPGIVIYIGPASVDGLQQVNAWLPAGIRTGLVPAEILLSGVRLCDPATVRIIPAGPPVPRIVSITDGVNLVQKNASSTGLLKIQIEEISSAEEITATIDGKPIERLESPCVDPRPPRYEVNLRLPEDLQAGRYRLEIQLGRRRLLPAEVDIL